MPKRLIGIILIITGLVAFHLFGNQPETKPLWQKSINYKIYSSPVATADRFIFLAGDKGKREFQLTEINAEGTVTARSPVLPVLPYDPISFDGIVVLGDRARIIRGFSVPGLNLEWESGTVAPFPKGPVKSGTENFLVQSELSVLFCLSSKTGQPAWDKTFTDQLANYAADKVVICLHGYADVKKPAWKASGLDPDTGQTLWTIEQKLSANEPLFVQDIVIFTTTEGEILVVDQLTGQVLYKHPVPGLKAFEIFDDILIMLASGGSRLVCLSLMDGSSWTTTLQSGFVGAGKYGNRLLVSDKKNLRCLDASNGALVWTKNLQDVYNAFAFRNGIFVTHKDSFFARDTFGSYIETSSPDSLWLAYDRSIFNKPLVTSQGDLLLSYNGNYRMMGKALAKSTIPAQLGVDPAEKINFWKNKTASETSADTSKSEKEKPANNSDAQLDDGWGSND